MFSSLKIINANVVTPNGLLIGEVFIKDGIIEKISDKVNQPSTDNIIDAKGRYLLPGFIDIHTNGSAGFDCTYGVYDTLNNTFDFDENEYITGLNKAVKSYIDAGCTKVILSTISAPFEQILQVINFIKNYKKKETLINNVIFGLMIEGSFIKETANAGAHNPDYFQCPEEKILSELLTGNEEIIKIVNIPPEWGENSINSYKILNEKKIIAAAGHTCASAYEINKAVTYGLSLAIHLFNGPSYSSYKPFEGGGAIEAFLKAENVFAEIIADGLHVDKSYFLDALKRKGNEKVIAITDNMFVTGSGIKSEFRMGEKLGVVSDDFKYLYIKEKPNALFGSNLKMNEAFVNLLNWLTSDTQGVWNKIHRANKFEEALMLASKMCSGNPADLLKISGSYGSVAEGMHADLVLAEIKYDKFYTMEINKVILNGNIIN